MGEKGREGESSGETLGGECCFASRGTYETKGGTPMRWPNPRWERVPLSLNNWCQGVL